MIASIGLSQLEERNSFIVKKLKKKNLSLINMYDKKK